MTRNRALTIAASMAITLLLLLATVGTAAAATRFGAKLDGTRQPSNAESGWWCQDNDEALPNPTCTWVSTEAFGRPGGGYKAPKNGTIDKVRVVSCFPDTFQLQIARAKPAEEKAKVVRNGPKVSFNGDPDECQDDDIFKVSVVNVPNFHINKGEVIAIKDKETGALYCAGGGTVLTFHPRLQAGGNFQNADESESCFLLVELQYTS